MEKNRGLFGALTTFLPKSNFFRSVTILAGGTAVGQGIVVFASPFLSRLFSPGDFGVLAVYTSFLSIIVIIASLRYEVAILLPEDEESAFHLLALALIMVFVTTLIVSVGIWSFGDSIMLMLNSTSLSPYLSLLPLSILGLGINRALNFWAIRQKMFFSVAKTKVSQSIGMVLTQLAVGIIQKGPLGLLLGDVSGRIFGSGTLGSLALRNSKTFFRSFSFLKMCKLAYLYRRYPIFSSWSGLLNSGGVQLPPLIIVSLYGSDVVGWFALGMRVISMPMSMVGQAVSQVYMGETSQLLKKDPDAIFQLYLSTAKRLFLVGLVPFSVIIAAGPSLFEIVFGAEWRKTGEYMQILSFMFLAEFVVSPLSQTLEILEKQHLQLSWQTVRMILVVLALILPAYMDMGPSSTIFWYGIAMFFSYIILFFIIAKTLTKSGIKKMITIETLQKGNKYKT